MPKICFNSTKNEIVSVDVQKTHDDNIMFQIYLYVCECDECKFNSFVRLLLTSRADFQR